MAFKDNAALNQHLADHSYVEGFVPSQADVAAFDALKGACPDKAAFPHAARWYRHIESFEAAGRKQFPKGSGVAPVAAAAADDDDDVDLFGSDEEDDEAQEKIKAERVAAYTAKKSNKPALIAKTSVLLDVKPWDDETDMGKLRDCVKSIQKEGLVWGADKLVPVGYGINKLQIICVVEDEKVSIDELQENITDFEDFVQSCDIAAMNKI